MILLAGWSFGFYPKIVFWLGSCIVEFRSHLKPLALQIKNLRQTTFQLGMVLFCLSSPCLLSYPAFPFLSTHLTQLFVSAIPWKFLLLKSTRTSNLPNLRENSQCSFFKDHSAAWTELITHFFSWNTFLICHPTLLVFSILLVFLLIPFQTCQFLGLLSMDIHSLKR